MMNMFFCEKPSVTRPAFSQTSFGVVRAAVFLWFSLLLVFASQSRAGSEAVGLIVLSKGKVIAVSGGGDERDLKRRSKLFDGDRVVTGVGAKAQIKFTDGSLIALRNDTELLIENYHYSQRSGEEKSILKLVKGGFRAITGVIGKNNPDDYKVKTNLATIGIRGTHFELVMTQTLGVAVWDGGVWVENNAGKMLLGKDAGFQFARVNGVDQMPKGLLKPPAGISSSPSAESASEEGKEKAEQKKPKDQEEHPKAAEENEEPSKSTELAEVETRPGDAKEELGGVAGEEQQSAETAVPKKPLETEASDPAGEVAANQTANPKSPPTTAAGVVDGPEGATLEKGFTEASGDFVPVLTQHHDVNGVASPEFQGVGDSTVLEYWGQPLGAVADEGVYLDNPIQPRPPEVTLTCADGGGDQSCLTSLEGFETTEETVVSSHFPAIEEEEAVVDSGAGGGLSGSVVDSRLSDQELQGLLPLASFAVAAGSGASEGLPFVWKDDLQVTLNGQGEPVFVALEAGDAADGTVAPLYVIRKGEATQGLAPDVDLGPVPADIFYGVWWGNVAPVQVFSDAGDSTSFNALDYPVFWVHAPPIAAASLGGLGGTLYFDRGVFFSGQSNAGPVTNVNLRIDVNMDSLVVTAGEFQVGSGPLGRPDLENVWDFDFVGAFDEQSLVVENGILNGTYTEAGGQGTQEAEGLLSGFFTGSNGEMLVGAFYASSLEDTSAYASGVYGVSYINPLDRIGMLTIASGKQFGLTADNGPEQVLDQAFIGGRASDGGTGSAQIEHRAGGPLNPDFDSQDLIYSVTRGEADFQVFGDGFADKVPVGVATGIWFGNVETPVKVETADGLVDVDRPVYWLTALPSPDETMSILEGVGVYYGESTFFTGEGSAGPIADFQMGFSVDFSSKQINSGFLSIVTQGGQGQDFWNLTFSGAVDGPLLRLNESLLGTVCSDQFCSGSSAVAEGEVNGLFVGEGAGGVVGAFHFWDGGDVNRFVAGTYGMETYYETLGYDNRIDGDFSSGEQFDLSSSQFDAFLVIGNGQPLNLKEEGGTEEVMLFNGRSLVDTGAGQLNLLKEHEVAPFGVVFRPGASSLDQPGNDVIGGDRSIYWGRWASNSLIQDDATDPTSSITLQDPVFWVAGNISSLSAIPVDVQRVYQTTVMLQGTGYNGALTNGSLQMTVDFDSQGQGLLSNGVLSYQTGAGASQWLVNFNGVSNGAYIDMETSSGTLTESGDSIPVYGDLRGAFVGESASTQGVIGGFRFEAIGEPSKHSEGVFFVTQ